MSLRRDERGFVLVTALIILVVFMAITVAMVTIVNVQTNQTGHERSGEAAFELAQSALRAEAYQLQTNWPVDATHALPTTCNQATIQEAGCEGTALVHELQKTASGQLVTGGPDYANATWQAKVFDNAAGYSASPQTIAYDQNGDNRMWVWATAKTPNGQTRTVVEQVTRRLQTASLPESAVTAGGLYTQSNGNPVIIEASDPASGVTGPVDVRCSAAGPPPSGNCIGWQPGQLVPTSAYQTGYGGSGALTAAQIGSLIQQAQTAGTLYNTGGGSTATPGAIPGCPPAGTYSPPPAGQSYPLVVVEGAGACSYNNDWFSQASLGVLVFLQGSVSIGPGNPHFYGLLYMANQGSAPPAAGSVCTAAQISSAPTLVTTAGSAQIDGAVFVDGCGLVGIQDNGDALNFSLSALQLLQTYGSAAPVPGTFRVVTQ
jgi:Tfp pilus assembly protein PilX